LRRRLIEEYGFTLWQDLADMEGGKDWWRQIEEAIKSVEYLVLVMTPGALRSDVTRKEWRLARFFGTSERFWMNLQTRYDLEVEKDRLGGRLEKEVRVYGAAS
jgi:hypothetical protein